MYIHCGLARSQAICSTSKCILTVDCQDLKQFASTFRRCNMIYFYSAAATYISSWLVFLSTIWMCCRSSSVSVWVILKPLISLLSFQQKWVSFLLVKLVQWSDLLLNNPLPPFSPVIVVWALSKPCIPAIDVYCQERFKLTLKRFYLCNF